MFGGEGNSAVLNNIYLWTGGFYEDHPLYLSDQTSSDQYLFFYTQLNMWYLEAGPNSAFAQGNVFGAHEIGGRLGMCLSSGNVI
eukprot:TRINITY_DN7799_c0_g1_i1.p1 TRINITY_DN7799_c0_g1~~TRINITY_DN7799_c0_g1_i1.p1  ORF type:complete len:93 (-),score=4.90 TRINITY_DN7799_c0_g1_i1:45-296(-)